MSNTAKWWLGIIILAIIALLLSVIGPFSALKNSNQMGASVQSALSAAGHDDISVDMVGNVARLSGESSSDAAKTDALSVAQNAKCEKCMDSGKRWHEAKDAGLTVAKAPIVSPYTFTATKNNNGRVVLDGYVRDQEELDDVMRQAEQLFPRGVVNRTLKIASGEPSADWRKVIGINLVDLSKLDTGKVTITDQNTVLTGRTESADIYRDVAVGYQASLPNPYTGVANVRAPEVEPVAVEEVTSQQVCQILFDQLKGDNKVNFAYDKAEIRGVESFELLNTLASAAKQCAAFRIDVGGHTDWDGSDSYNQWLSDARAKSVVAYLADNGVELSRMTATGYGESQPISSNETPEGMAQNRRIEFKVTRSN